MTRKRCSSCRRVFGVGRFSANAGRADGLAHQCKTCANARNEVWRKKNLVRCRENAKRWIAANKERHEATSLAYRKAHRKEAAAAAKAWYAANKDRRHARERVQDWHVLLANACVNSSKIRGHVSKIDAAFILELFERQGGKCYWTGVPMVPSPTKVDPQRPSVDRLDNSVGYTRKNSVLTCRFVNTGRWTTEVVRFTEFIETLRAAMRKRK